MRVSRVFSSALLCTSAVSAWSWPGARLSGAVEDLILPHKRAPQRVTLGSDTAATPNPSQATTTQAPSSSATDSATNSKTASSSNSNSNSGSNTASATGTGSSSGSQTSARSSTTVIDPRLPPGGISMITPNPRSSTQYYKIGNYITFAWNYTSLSVTPSAVDILATCSKNQATYTLALNQTIDGPTGAVTWDTNGYQATATVPLLTETYTLIVHDAQKPITAVASAGYLAAINTFSFGMYSPQPYKDLGEFVCVTCSGALSALERQSLTAVGIMAGMAVLGATWFSGGML